MIANRRLNSHFKSLELYGVVLKKRERERRKKRSAIETGSKEGREKER